MKRHYYYYLAAAAAALLALTGCDRQALSGDAQGTTQSVPVWFEPVGGPSTKVDIDGTDGFGSWTEGDKIAVYVQGDGANFYQIKPVESIQAAPDHNKGSVMVSLAAGQNRANYAIYPATSAVAGHVTTGDLYVNYPAEYDYSRLTATQLETYSPTPMVAINRPVADLSDPDSAPTLEFYHVGGVLRLTVPGVPQTAYSLRFIFPEGFKLSGTFAVTDGGTASATLADAGLDDHSNVLDVKRLPLEEAITNLVLNIPMPYGTDYTSGSRDFKVEVRTEQIAYMQSDGIVNFASILRAQGKKQAVPRVETLGTMVGMYMTRGYLLRPNNTTVNPADMSLSGTDPMEPLNYYGRVYQRRIYINPNQLGKIMTGDPDFTLAGGTRSFEDARLTIDGVSYRVPTVVEWHKIIFGGRPGAIVNDQPSVRWAKVQVDITTQPYANNQNPIKGVLMFPDGGVYDIPGITVHNNSTHTSLTWEQYRRLTDGPTGCIFLPYVGSNYTNDASNSSGLNSTGVYPSSTNCSGSGETKVYTAYFNLDITQASNTSSIYNYPVRLIRE